MNRNDAIELGKEKVQSGYCRDQFNELNDRIFEILGYTKADYYGTDEITNLKRRSDVENDIYDMKFYQYLNQELVECEFGTAISTPEYNEDDIFLFSQMEDEKRHYYLTVIINKWKGL